MATQAEPDPAATQRRASRARTALIEATKRLVVRSVFGTFTIDDVTREAGVARGSFYNHFASIDDLITTTQATAQEQLNDEVAAAIADSPDAATSMVRGMVVVMRFGYQNRANARLLLSPGPGTGDPEHPANRELSLALRAGIEHGDFDLRNIEAGIVATRGIAESGLARMIDIHHELSAVRELTIGMSISLLRALGVDPARLPALVDDAMQRGFPAPTPSHGVADPSLGD